MSHEDEIAAVLRPSTAPAAGAAPPTASRSPLTPGIVTAVSGTPPTQVFSVTIRGATTAATGIPTLVGVKVNDKVWLLPIGAIDGPGWLIIGVQGGLPILKSGSLVGTTNSGGDLAVSFPTAFPAAYESIVVSNGDANVSTLLVFSIFSASTAGFSVNTRISNTGAVLASTSIRLNWMATGH